SDQRTVNLVDVDRIVSDPESEAVAQQIADRSITLVRDDQKYIPLSLKGLMVIAFTDDENRTVAQPVISELQNRSPQVDAVTLDIRQTEDSWPNLGQSFEFQAPAPLFYSSFVNLKTTKVPAPCPKLAIPIFKKIPKPRPRSLSIPLAIRI